MKQLNKLKKQIRLQEKKRQRNKFRFGLIVGLLVLTVVLLVAGGVIYFQQRPAWEMARAENALVNHQYDRALAHFQRVYRRDPNALQAPEAMYRAGSILHRYKQEYRQAILLFLKMEDQYPESPFLVQALQETAEIYKLRLQDPGRAVGTYRRLVELAPEQADLYQMEVGNGYFQLGNYEQARIEFEQLLRQWPTSSRAAEVILRIGLMYSLEGKLLQSEEQFKRLITNFPDSPFFREAQIGLVGVYEERGELKTALDLLTEVQEAHKDDPHIQQRLKQVKARLLKKNKK